MPLKFAVAVEIHLALHANQFFVAVTIQFSFSIKKT